MAKKIYTNLDLQGNNLVNAVFENLSVVPASPKEGQIYFDVGDKKDKIFDGTKWIDRATTQELNSGLDKKVDKVVGKQLSTNDFTNDYKSQVDSNTSARHTHSNKAVLDGTQESFTTALKSKLEGVASGAQVNVIETIEVNGTAQPVTSKTVDISVPTKTSELQNDSDFATNSSLTSGLNTKVDKVTGKQLSTNDFSNDYKSKVDSNTSARHTHTNKTILDATTASFTTSDESKLNGIASGAQVNVIESIKVNGAAQPVTSKSVNISVPTKTSQLQNDSEFVTLSDLDDSEAGIITGLENKVDKIEGKGLSTNDFTDSYQSQVNSNTTARHTHSNKAILDATTASFTTAINNTINSKANASEVVKLTGNQTIQDTKTFEEPIIGNLQGNSDSATVTKYSGVGELPAQGTVGNSYPVGLSVFRVESGTANKPDGLLYGHVINIRGKGNADGQLILTWTGDSTTPNLYYRSHRESPATGWTPWRKIAYIDDTVARATSDGNGNNIAATYATKDEIADLGVKKLTLGNPQLVPSNGVVEWTVDYSSMGGIVANPPMVSIMRKSDYKQILAEVQFNLAGESCIIRMNSDVTIPAQSYVVTIIG